MLQKIRPRVTLYLEVNGQIVMDEELYYLLKCIMKEHSILAASRKLGLPYSSALEKILRAERIIKKDLVKRKRGGRGGAELTENAIQLLTIYEDYAKKYGISYDKAVICEHALADLIIAGSNDIAVDLIANELRKRNITVEEHWTGSLAGILALLVDEADIVGVHLYDPKTGEYNLPFLKKYELKNVILVRGYMREIGFVYRDDVPFNNPEDIVIKKLKIVNRNVGSGTRFLMDHILLNVFKKLGLKGEFSDIINGYDFEVRTHEEVARAVLSGKADVGIAIRYVAEFYGLKFKTIKWECFDFLISKKKLKKQSVNEFIRFLGSIEFKRLLARLTGYKALGETGQKITSF